MNYALFTTLDGSPAQDAWKITTGAYVSYHRGLPFFCLFHLPSSFFLLLFTLSKSLPSQSPFTIHCLTDEEALLRRRCITHAGPADLSWQDHRGMTFLHTQGCCRQSCQPISMCSDNSHARWWRLKQLFPPIDTRKLNTGILASILRVPVI